MKMNLGRTIGKVCGIAALATTGITAYAQDAGSLLIRGRAVQIQSANRDSTGLGLSINDKTIPEVDISYFLSPNLAAELILTYPQKHEIRSNGARIGSLKHLPPTLTVQYHITGLSGIRPYIGAGVNYTRLSSVNFDPAVAAALHPSVKRDSFGLAAQIGADIAMGNGWFLNVDVKKVQLGTTVYSSGTSVGKFKVDPTLVAIGVGKLF